MKILYRANVTRMDARGVYVEVPHIATGMEFGPCQVNTNASLAVGDRVLAGQVEQIDEDLVILAKIGNIAEGADTVFGSVVVESPALQAGIWTSVPLDMPVGSVITSAWFMDTVSQEQAALDYQYPTLSTLNIRSHVDLAAGALTGVITATGITTETGGGGGDVGEHTHPPTSAYNVNFAIPALVWTLQHNLGRREVSIYTFDSNGDTILGDITYTNINTAHVTWYMPMAGSASVFL